MVISSSETSPVTTFVLFFLIVLCYKSIVYNLYSLDSWFSYQNWINSLVGSQDEFLGPIVYIAGLIVSSW